MDWRPVQSEPRLSPDDSWDGLQPPRDPTDGFSGYRKWMDGTTKTQHLYKQSPGIQYEEFWIIWLE